MLSIQFRIVDDFGELRRMSSNEIDRECSCILGYINICFGHCCEGGYYNDGMIRDGETGSELLNVWFSQLLDILNSLQTANRHVAMKEIETVNTWITFERRSDKVSISTAKLCPAKVQQANLATPLLMVDTPQLFIDESGLGETVLYQELKDAVCHAANDFFARLREINPLFENSNMLNALKAKMVSHG